MRWLPLAVAVACVAEDPGPGPRITLTPPAGRSYADVPVALEAALSDADDAVTALAVAWRSDRDGPLGGAPAGTDGIARVAAPLTEGAHTVTVTVTDPAGNRASADAAVTVGPANRPPTCAWAAPEVVDGGLRLTAVVDDADEGPDGLVVAFSSDRDGVLGTTTGAAPSLTVPLSAGPHVLTVTVSDEVGRTCTADERIAGQAPTLVLVHPADGSVWPTGEPVAFEAVAVDAPAELVWTLDGVGRIDPPGEGQPDADGRAWFTRDDLPAGLHALSVAVGADVLATAEFRLNTAPTAPVVDVAPAEPTTADDLVAELIAGSLDADGDVLTYRWTWLRDGNPALEGAEVLPAEQTAKGERWTVEVRASDAFVEGPPGSVTVTVANAAPVVHAVTVTPADPTVVDALTCAVDASDADADLLEASPSWWVDDAFAGDGPTLDAGLAARGATVVCRALVDDGETTSPVVASAPVRIGDSPPVVTDVAVIPADPMPGDRVRCTWAFADADGDVDASTVAWTVDGVPAGDGPTLDTSLEVGAEVRCTVTPRAAEAAGAPVDGAATVEPALPPHNVLVVLADDLGVDKVDRYGVHPDPPSTPVIDSLIDDGVRFTRAYTAPSCSPTRASWQTGRTPHQHGVTFALSFFGHFALRFDEETTLPEWLDARSGAYDHSAIGKWHLGTEDFDFWDNPSRHGWGWHSGSLHGMSDVSTSDGLPQDYFDWEKHEDGAIYRSGAYITTDNVDDAIARVNAMPEPWLLYVAFNAPHSPYHWPPDELWSGVEVGDDSNSRKYNAAVEALDTELGRLLAHVDGHAGDTTVVFFGDNGTPVGGITPPADPDRAKETPYEGGVRVPFVVAGPYVSAPGSAADALIQSTDLFATVAAIANAPLDGSLDVDSVSLLPYLRDPSTPSLRDIVTAGWYKPPGLGPTYDTGAHMARGERYKLVQWWDGREELYDLEGVAIDHPEDDLMAAGPLSAEAEAARDRLRAALPDVGWGG